MAAQLLESLIDLFQRQPSPHIAGHRVELSLCDEPSCSKGALLGLPPSHGACSILSVCCSSPRLVEFLGVASGPARCLIQEIGREVFFHVLHGLLLFMSSLHQHLGPRESSPFLGHHLLDRLQGALQCADGCLQAGDVFSVNDPSAIVHLEGCQSSQLCCSAVEGCHQLLKAATILLSYPVHRSRQARWSSCHSGTAWRLVCGFCH
mmetsp:Transcript_22574/g.62671  ORF Transcript_22574/g.62671 Transcript_22574/m.62671 type:complete len:206 (-) Transcript_22574:384-1001(-)